MLFPKPSDTDIDATVITIVFMLEFYIMPPDIESAYRMAARFLRDRRRDVPSPWTYASSQAS